jgi:hypothetical protein
LTALAKSAFWRRSASPLQDHHVDVVRYFRHRPAVTFSVVPAGQCPEVTGKAIYIFSVLFVYRNKNGELMPCVGVILAGVQLFFLTISNFVVSPFKALGVANASGAFDW